MQPGVYPSSEEGSLNDDNSHADMNVDADEIDETYRLKLNTIIKPYKNAQARTSVSLGVVECNVSSVELFKTEIYRIASHHVEGVAVLSGSDFSMRREPLQEEDLRILVSFKQRNHHYTIDSMLHMC